MNDESVINAIAALIAVSRRQFISVDSIESCRRTQLRADQKRNEMSEVYALVAISSSILFSTSALSLLWPALILSLPSVLFSLRRGDILPARRRRTLSPIRPCLRPVAAYRRF